MQGVEECFRKAVTDPCRVEKLFIRKTRTGGYKKNISEIFKELLEIRNVIVDMKIQYMGRKIK